MIMSTKLFSVSSFQSVAGRAVRRALAPISHTRIPPVSVSLARNFSMNKNVRRVLKAFESNSPESTSASSSSWMDKNKRYESRIDDYDYDLPRKYKENEKTAQGKGSFKRKESAEAAPSSSFRDNFLGTRVFVQNIPLDVSWQDLKDHFRVAGNVVFASVSVNSDGSPKGCGVVQFETVSEAQNAIAVMRNHPMKSSVEPLFVREDYQEERSSSHPSASGRMGGGSGLLKSDRMNKKWRCANDENASIMDADTTERVLAIIRARDAARKRRNYEASDAMRDELKTQYNVHLDDRLYLWWNHFEGGTVPSKLADVKGEGSWDAPKKWRQIPTTPDNDLCVDADLVNGLLMQRDIARREKDFATADKLLEQARNAPDGDLYLRIHDESRTWRIWTDEPPPKAASNRQRANGSEKEQSAGGENEMKMETDVIDECLSLVSENDPDKVDEVRELLSKFPGRQYNILSKLKQRYNIL